MIKNLVLTLMLVETACASNSPPPAASADAQAANIGTSSYGGSQALPTVTTSDVGTLPRSPATDSGQPSAAASDASGGATKGTTTAASNAANIPAGTKPDSNPTSAAPAPSAADNSRANTRDRSGNTLTPMDQGGSENDRRVTQQIRQAIIKDGSLSFDAKNVKIMTVSGKVTLRGPVKSEAERTTIEGVARKIAGETQVENLLEIKK